MSALARGALLAALALAVCFPGRASAQATRTWVSGVGDDANPCTRTAPCLTWAGALQNTAAGGEIDALDTGDFGPVIIDKAITLDGPAGRASIDTHLFAADAITVAAPAGAAVVLRRLSLLGDGTHAGIRFVSGASLHVEDCVIEAFSDGIAAEPAAGGSLYVSEVTARDNEGAGLFARTLAPNVLRAIVSDSRFEHNGIGVRVGGGAQATVYASTTSSNFIAGLFAFTEGSGGIADLNLQDVTAIGNGYGVVARSLAGTATVRMSEVFATRNDGGSLLVSGPANIHTFGDNQLDPAPALSLLSAAPSQTVKPGASATYAVTAKVGGVLANPITLACSGLPAGAACVLSTTTLPAGAAGGDFTVEVQTAASATMMGALPRPHAPMAAALIVPALFFFARRRRSLGLLLGLWLCTVGLAACGDDSGSADLGPTADLAGSAPDLAPAPLPPGSYDFQITATSGTVTATRTLTLVVTP